jgi:hypothetical protein
MPRRCLSSEIITAQASSWDVPVEGRILSGLPQRATGMILEPS